MHFRVGETQHLIGGGSELLCLGLSYRISGDVRVVDKLLPRESTLLIESETAVQEVKALQGELDALGYSIGAPKEVFL